MKLLNNRFLQFVGIILAFIFIQNIFSKDKEIIMQGEVLDGDYFTVRVSYKAQREWRICQDFSLFGGLRQEKYNLEYYPKFDKNRYHVVVPLDKIKVLSICDYQWNSVWIEDLQLFSNSNGRVVFDKSLHPEATVREVSLLSIDKNIYNMNFGKIVKASEKYFAKVQKQRIKEAELKANHRVDNSEKKTKREMVILYELFIASYMHKNKKIPADEIGNDILLKGKLSHYFNQNLLENLQKRYNATLTFDGNMPVDMWGNPFEYKQKTVYTSGKENHMVYIYSLGKNGIPDLDDDIIFRLSKVQVK